MALGRYISDLEQGDVMGPVEYTLSPFAVREYCHAVELDQEYFQGKAGQIAPPTLIHLEKLRLYRHACPEGTGPSARLHIEFDATFHEPIPVGVKLRVKGTVSRRYVKRGRDYVHTDIELRTAADDRLLALYRDTVVLAFQQNTAEGAAS